MAGERSNCWDWVGPEFQFTVAYEKQRGAAYKVHEIPSDLSITTTKETPKPYRTAWNDQEEIRRWLNDPLRQGEFYLHVWGNSADTIALVTCRVDNPDTAFEFKLRWC